LVVGVIVKLIFIPSITIASTDAAGVMQTTMPVYDLDVHHPGMKNLTVEEAPQP
jgi:hypothetical protein